MRAFSMPRRTRFATKTDCAIRERQVRIVFVIWIKPPVSQKFDVDAFGIKSHAPLQIKGEAQTRGYIQMSEYCSIRREISIYMIDRTYRFESSSVKSVEKKII